MRNKQVEFNPYIYTYQNCPVLAMKYPFLNIQQGGIQNSGRSSRLITYRMLLHGKMDVKFFLMFIVAENTRRVNIMLLMQSKVYTKEQ